MQLQELCDFLYGFFFFFFLKAYPQHGGRHVLGVPPSPGSTAQERAQKLDCRISEEDNPRER